MLAPSVTALALFPAAVPIRDVGALPAAVQPREHVVFQINAAADRRPISPLVYGINMDANNNVQFARVMAEARPGMLRLGGNRWTAYNWENNDSNAGSDWQFQNDDFLASSTQPAAAVLPTVYAAEKAHIPVLVTVPIAGYVSADRDPPGPVMGSGANYLNTRFKIDAPRDSRPLGAAPDRSSKYVYQDQFVYFLRKHAAGAQLMFSLDNEPDLWASTHKEIHPKPTTYTELLGKDLAYARAVKAVDPGALVTGPVSYGWEGYLTLQDAPGWTRYGNFLNWWMRQVKAADLKAGTRLLNDLDVHWYPEATGTGHRITGTGTAPGEVVAREQAPRSLWDPSYVEKSWITQWSTGGKGIDLIHRLQAQIAANNPGMGLDFSEWDYGATDDISGAIATADVLGIFGRYGVHAADFWGLGGANAYAYAAFAAFRNYDGHGAAFGSTEVGATTTDNVGTSLYASLTGKSADHLVIVAINKNFAPTTASIRIHGFTANRAAVYILTSATPRVRPAPSLHGAAAAGLTYVMPAQSISIIVPTS